MGCVTTSIQTVSGFYSLDTSQLCSQANHITIHLKLDGVVIETGSSPGIVDDRGEPHAWEREGRWQIEGSGIVLSFEDEADQFFRFQHVKGNRALIQVSAPGARIDPTAVRYLRWQEQPEDDEEEPNQALQTTPVTRSEI